MDKLLPADLKAIALSAWLFFSERGFACDLIHEEDATHAELRIVYEDSRTLPRCPILEQSHFSCEITRVCYSDMVCRYYIPDLFV